jgi:hypothetical protein
MTTTAELIYNYVKPVKTSDGLRFFFVSEGELEIVKVVEYKYVGIRQNRSTYNLGFGTYIFETDGLDDPDISNNGDHYKVFNTVLSTIPRFLDLYPEAMIVVEGSDSTSSFPENCRLNCRKKCIAPDCKNANRRINIYKKYVNKNYNQLSKEYVFWGTIKGNGNKAIIEEYRIINNYNSVLFIKK